MTIRDYVRILLAILTIVTIAHAVGTVQRQPTFSTIGRCTAH